VGYACVIPNASRWRVPQEAKHSKRSQSLFVEEPEEKTPSLGALDAQSANAKKGG
jgi:hypothetical protein